MLNAYVYRGITGQWKAQDLDLGQKEAQNITKEILMHRRVLTFLEKMGYDTKNSDNLIRQATIFHNQSKEFQQAFMPKKVFENNFNQYMMRTPEIFEGATKMSELPSKIAAKQISAITGGVNTNDLVGFKLQGQKNGLYGIGLGQFFSHWSLNWGFNADFCV